MTSCRVSVVSSAVALVAASLFAPPADAQTLTRFQLPGGRQHALGIQVAAFTNDERFFFVSVDDGFVPGDVNGFVDVARYDLATGDYEAVVPGALGAPLDGPSLALDASTDGRFLLFESDATNLGVPHGNGLNDLFLRDLVLATTARVSLTANGTEPNGSSAGGSVSDDGRYVVFDSEASDMLPGDLNGTSDVFLRDMLLGTTELLSRGLGGGFASGASVAPQISIDGRYVMFLSDAPDLVSGDTNALQDLFLIDRLSATIERVNLGPGGVEANGEVVSFSMAQSGELVAFDSTATNLVAGPAASTDVYVFDLVWRSLVRATGAPGGPLPDAACFNPRMSGDSGWVAYQTAASNIHPGDIDGEIDVYYVDLATGFVEWISRATTGDAGAPPSGQVTSIENALASYTGGYVVFSSNLEGLVAGDTNLTFDAFLWNTTTSGGPIAGFCTAKVNSLGCTPTITSGGEARASGPLDDFFVSAHDLRNNEPGILLWSGTPAATPFYGGLLCLAPPVRRTPPQVAGGTPTGHDCTGTFSFHFSQAYMAARGISPGVTIYAQYWSRDNGYAPPNNVGLTGGISFSANP